MIRAGRSGRRGGDRGGEDLAAVVGDQHVLLEAHAAEAVQLVDAIPVDAVAAALAGEQRGNDVDSRLDGPRLARLERDVDAQARQAGRGFARLVGGRAGVADAEADQVADAVREEQRRRAALDQRLGRAAQDAELDEPFRDHQRRRAVDVVPLRPGRQAAIAVSPARRTVS